MQEIHGTRYGTDEGVDLAVRKAILARMDELREEQPYRTIDGQTLPVSLTLIDASYRTDVVYATCKELAPIVKPAMGIGQSAGCVQARW